MLETKSGFIKYLAQSVATQQIITEEKFDEAIEDGYVANGIIYPWIKRRPKCEYHEIYLAAKNLHGVNLSSFDPLKKSATHETIAKLIQRRGYAREILDNTLKTYEPSDVADVSKTPLILMEIGIMSLSDVQLFFHNCRTDLPEFAEVYDSLLRGYIANKVIEGIVSKTIETRYDKERMKRSLAESLGLHRPPSDSSIYGRIVQTNPHVIFPKAALDDILHLTLLLSRNEDVFFEY